MQKTVVIKHPRAIILMTPSHLLELHQGDWITVHKEAVLISKSS